MTTPAMVTTYQVVSMARNGDTKEQTFDEMAEAMTSACMLACTGQPVDVWQCHNGEKFCLIGSSDLDDAVYSYATDQKVDAYLELDLAQ